MTKQTTFFALLVMLLLAACSANAPGEQAAGQAPEADIVVYRVPT